MMGRVRRMPWGEEFVTYKTGEVEPEYQKYQQERKPILTEAQVLDIARVELRKAGLKGVTVKVTKYQGKDPMAARSDASCFSRIQHKIHLHPIVLYYSPDEVRELMWHEIEHVLEDEDEFDKIYKRRGLRPQESY